MRTAAAVVAVLLAGTAFAKLPPPDDAAKAAAAETAAKAAWTDKVGLYQLCRAMDRTVEAYRKGAVAAGKAVPAPVPTAPCAEPGPYVSPVTAAANKPLEASGAHSPPGTAVSPPSTKTPDAEMKGKPN